MTYNHKRYIMAYPVMEARLFTGILTFMSQLTSRNKCVRVMQPKTTLGDE